MDNKNDQDIDVRSVVEAVSADLSFGAPLYVVESMCMRCQENGTTRFLLTLIPHFRKVLISAFECPHCGERNNEVQFAGEIQPRGCCYNLEVLAGDVKIFDRQVVKSESATIKIPELDFEIPPEAQRGSLSTVEGILARAADELSALQEERKKVDPKTAEAIDQFLSKLRACAKAETSFTFILDDPAGNSFIENPHAPSPDPSLTIKFYERTPEQQATLGYVANPSQAGQSEGSLGAPVMTFPSTCGACTEPCETRMFKIEIPYFQEVIVMASTCDSCGYRNSELKPGGAIPEKGKKITLSVRNITDLSRDVIKSDTAGVIIPELDLELAGGTLGGMVTTVEGLVTQIRESLARVHGFTFGDSMEESKLNKWREFGARLTKLLSFEQPWTLILDDELANSFIAPVTDDIKDDHQLTFEEYERSWDQNEELGLNDIDTSSADAAYESTETTKLP
uniref:Zinc finger protein-like n=1 Tax=Arabidopsis thaliana TaxID=3702 RepID=Q9FK90_ARATH|nr:zinc finger protein-like [Arabidopsis thaliana]